MTIDFGWEIPTGRRRMPGAAATYEAHLRRVLDRLSGHFHSAWMPDHFVDNHMDVPEAMISLSYLAALYPALHFGPVLSCLSTRSCRTSSREKKGNLMELKELREI